MCDVETVWEESERKRLEAKDRRIAELEKALKVARKWGISSTAFSAEVSDMLAKWVDGGMKWKAPEVPSYYPNAKVSDGD